MTLFPETVGDVLSESIIGRAQERDILKIRCHQIRDFTPNKQNQVDDYPYGGGMGMLIQADPLYNCWEYICDQVAAPVHTIFMTPGGRVFTQDDAKRLSKYENIVIVCGHYEGIDQRFVDECVDEELSIGDFVLTGGEIPAMAVADSICRLIPGVLSDEECFTGESHWSGLLEYPQYSRPETWHGRSVPPVLLSGDHKNIAMWRTRQSFTRTKSRRPDMAQRFDIDAWLSNEGQFTKREKQKLRDSWEGDSNGQDQNP